MHTSAPRSAATRPERSKRAVTSAELPNLVDITEVSVHLGVSVRHVRRLVAERRIPYLKWGNLLRFDPDEIARWLTDRKVHPLTSRRSTRGVV